MTKLTFGIIAVLVGGLATAVLLQHHAQARLRCENDLLRQQNGLLSQMAAENEHLSNLVTQANRPLPAAAEPAKELLRLRGEVGVLRQQNQELAKMLLGQREGLPLSSHGSGFEPSASWADAGNATPQSAAETFCWAIKTGNTDRLAAVFVQPDPGNTNAAVLLSQMSQGLESLLSQIDASRLLVTDSPTPDETTLWFQSRLKSGETLVSPLTLQQVGNEWKVKFSLGR